MGTAEEDPTTPAHTAGAPPSSRHIGARLGATLPRLPRPGHLLAGWTRGNPLPHSPVPQSPRVQSGEACSLPRRVAWRESADMENPQEAAGTRKLW